MSVTDLKEHSKLLSQRYNISCGIFSRHHTLTYDNPVRFFRFCLSNILVSISRCIIEVRDIDGHIKYTVNSVNSIQQHVLSFRAHDHVLDVWPIFIKTHRCAVDYRINTIVLWRVVSEFSVYATTTKTTVSDRSRSVETEPGVDLIRWFTPSRISR